MIFMTFQGYDQSRNFAGNRLEKFGELLKKSVIIRIIIHIILIPFSTLLFTSSLSGVLIGLSLCVIGLGITFFVFQIKMVLRLRDARFETGDPFLHRSHHLFSAALVLILLQVFTSQYHLLNFLSVVAQNLCILLSLISIKNYCNQVHLNKNQLYLTKLQEGVVFFQIGVALSIFFQLLWYLLNPFILNAIVLFSLLDYVWLFLIVGGEFVFANGLLSLGSIRFQESNLSQQSDPVQYVSPSDSRLSSSETPRDTWNALPYNPLSTSSQDSQGTNKYCYECGKYITEDGWDFCPNCGTKRSN